MVNGKDVACWVIGGSFFLLAFMSLGYGEELSNFRLANIIFDCTIGLAFAISGSIFNIQREEN